MFFSVSAGFGGIVLRLRPRAVGRSFALHLAIDVLAQLDVFKAAFSVHGAIPHFSRAFYCGGGSGHVYFVALRRAPRRTVEYACGALGRAPCIHARLRRLATKSREKCGLWILRFRSGCFRRSGGFGIHSIHRYVFDNHRGDRTFVFRGGPRDRFDH